MVVHAVGSARAIGVAPALDAGWRSQQAAGVGAGIGFESDVERAAVATTACSPDRGRAGGLGVDCDSAPRLLRDAGPISNLALSALPRPPHRANDIDAGRVTARDLDGAVRQAARKRPTVEARTVADKLVAPRRK